MKPVGVGIIGCGNIGGFHAKVLGEAAGADLVAVCDQNDALAGQIAGQYGCAAYRDYRQLLGDSFYLSDCATQNRQIQIEWK